MSDDHLNNEVALSGQLTDSGVSAAAKSRAISSIDRLLGGLFDLASAPLENVAKRVRARGNADVALIREVGELRLAKLHADPEVARRIMDQHLNQIGKRFENKEAVVQVAIDDLKLSPPSEKQASSGPPELDEAFLSRFEKHAEEATTDQLRERWGRILSSEIRAPGTFSFKVMRIVDEIDLPTAEIFERACQHRIGNTLIKCLTGKLNFEEVRALVTSGLLYDPGMGQIWNSRVEKNNAGSQLNLLAAGSGAVGLPLDVKIIDLGSRDEAPVRMENGIPAVPVYVLTDAGHAISSILSHNETEVFSSLCREISKAVAPSEVTQYGKRGDQFISVQVWREDG